MVPCYILAPRFISQFMVLHPFHSNFFPFIPLVGHFKEACLAGEDNNGRFNVHFPDLNESCF